MPVYLIVRKSDGFVENAIKWDGESEFDPGAEYDLEQVSGEPGCPWIGWTRESDGSFTAPPEPVSKRHAIFRRNSGEVVAFTNIQQGQPVALTEPASFEYAIVECADESVVEGWTYSNGLFEAPVDVSPGN